MAKKNYLLEKKKDWRDLDIKFNCIKKYLRNRSIIR